jgi:hypothetical protein
MKWSARNRRCFIHKNPPLVFLDCGLWCALMPVAMRETLCCVIADEVYCIYTVERNYRIMNTKNHFLNHHWRIWVSSLTVCRIAGPWNPPRYIRSSFHWKCLAAQERIKNELLSVQLTSSGFGPWNFPGNNRCLILDVPLIIAWHLLLSTVSEHWMKNF